MNQCGHSPTCTFLLHAPHALSPLTACRAASAVTPANSQAPSPMPGPGLNEDELMMDEDPGKSLRSHSSRRFSDVQGWSCYAPELSNVGLEVRLCASGLQPDLW